MSIQKKSTKKFLKKGLKDKIKKKPSLKRGNKQRGNKFQKQTQNKATEGQTQSFSQDEQEQIKSLSIEDLLQGNKFLELNSQGNLQKDANNAPPLVNIKHENGKALNFQADNGFDEGNSDISDEQLSIDEDILEGELNQDSGSDEEMKTENVQAPKKGKSLTSKQFKEWASQVKNKPSFQGLKKILRVYRQACQNQSLQNNDENVKQDIQIDDSDPNIYNEIMQFSFNEMGGLLSKQLGLKDNFSADDVKKSKKWKNIQPLVKSYLGNSISFLGSINDDTMMRFALSKLRLCVPLLIGSERLEKKFLKLQIRVFQNTGSKDDMQSVQLKVQCVLFIRKMMVSLPEPVPEKCLKAVYRTFCSHAKFMTPGNVQHITFLAVSMAELLSINLVVSYGVAFTYIKELAIQLRGALVHNNTVANTGDKKQKGKSKKKQEREPFRDVYCWQFVNQLELWARALSTHKDKNEMQPLVYPLIQIVIGTIRLLPSPKFLPLRLRLIRSLHHLSHSTGYFIPLLSLLQPLLDWQDFKKPIFSKSTKRIPDLTLQLKVSKNTLKSQAFQEEVFSQVLELLAVHMSQWSGHITFPEFAHLPVVYLKSFVKTAKSSKFQQQVKALIQQIELTSQYIGQKRDKVNFAPKDLDKVQQFYKETSEEKLPIKSYSEMLVEKQKEKQREYLADTDSEIEEDKSQKEKSKLGKKQVKQIDNDDDEFRQQVQRRANQIQLLNKKQPNQKQLKQEISDSEVEDEVMSYISSGSDVQVYDSDT